jgi:hypothetical protein
MPRGIIKWLDGESAEVTMESPITGGVATRIIRMTPEAYDNWRRFKRPPLIQDAFPHLSPDDREFLLTGITPEEWNTHIKGESQ